MARPFWSLLIALGLGCLVAGGCGGGGSQHPPQAGASRSPEGEEDELSIEEALQTGLIRVDPPRAARVLLNGSAVVLTWTGTGGYVETFQVYRRELSASTWDSLGQVEVSGLSSGEFTFTDYAPASGKTYLYGVISRNEYNQRSSIVESPSITIP
jgi:hypothetical protein